eukprot:7593288-Pyramimonas_sp.AAC.1
MPQDRDTYINGDNHAGAPQGHGATDAICFPLGPTTAPDTEPNLECPDSLGNSGAQARELTCARVSRLAEDS